jgi:hypothetical protein
MFSSCIGDVERSKFEICIFISEAGQYIRTIHLESSVARAGAWHEALPASTHHQLVALSGLCNLDPVH